jgi:hypothetical protein
MKCRMNLLVVVALVFLLGSFNFGASTLSAEEPNMVKPGEFVIEPATLISLAFGWYIEGDENRDATVKVWYREKGDLDWKEALPLFRLQNEKVGGSFSRAAPNMFAGSIFDLEPDTEYECQFVMSDPDGVRGLAQRKVTVRTRAEPKPFEGGNNLHVYPYGYVGAKEQPAFTGLGGALNRVQPGDTILVHVGVYEDDFTLFGGHKVPGKRVGGQGYGLDFFGTYRFIKSGTPEKPIAIKAAGDGEVIFDGNGCFNLFDVMAADYLYFEGLTIINTDMAFCAGLSWLRGCSGLTVKNCRLENVGYGIMTGYAGSKDFYIADNVIIGRNDPTRLVGWLEGVGVPWQNFPGYPAKINGPEGSYMGISVHGNGHVVCHNYVTGFLDGIGALLNTMDSSFEPGSLDIYNNLISNISDNALQLNDYSHNVRVLRNVLINGAHIPLNVYPTVPLGGGPLYFIRNIVYHAPERGTTKFYGNPAGLILYHNTFCAEVTIGQPSVMTGASNLHFRNNLILGENPLIQSNLLPADFRGIFYMDTYTNYTTSDFNGFRPNEGFDMQFVWKAPASGVVRDYVNPREVRAFSTLEDLCNATGQECNGILVDYDIFENVPKPDMNDPTRVYMFDELDFRLKQNAIAVDKGCSLPNVNDNFTGSAPDLGALERGQPMPIYGPRP